MNAPLCGVLFAEVVEFRGDCAVSGFVEVPVKRGEAAEATVFAPLVPFLRSEFDANVDDIHGDFCSAPFGIAVDEGLHGDFALMVFDT